MGTHIFESREEAVDMMDWMWMCDYMLSHNEIGRPSLKVVKRKGLPEWRIHRTRHFFGPKVMFDWITEEEYEEYKSEN